MNSALFQSLFCYPRCQSQEEEEKEENDQEEEKDQEEEEKDQEEDQEEEVVCWRRSSCFRHLSFQMEMSTRHAFLYGVVCVDLACDWSIVFRSFHTCARGRPRLQTARTLRVGVGIRMYVRVQCMWSSGGGRSGGACAFLARSMATDLRALARLGSASTTRMRLLNGGWGIFSRWPRPLTYPARPFPETAWVVYGASG